MRKHALFLSLQLAVLAVSVTPALAQSDGWSGRRDHGSNPGHSESSRNGPPPGYRPPHGPPPRFADGGYRHGPGPDAWRGGAWRRDWHDGRFGWWWNVGPSWYAFNEPVYPYPAYVVPQIEIAPPPQIIVQAPPPIVVQAPPRVPGPAPTQFWYYCQQPKGYYPYVPSCNGSWQEVSAAPSR